MQVATLFRETATLLGASMESGGGNSQEMKGPTAICSPSSAALALKEAQYKDHRFKLMGVMNAEPQDDGYETSADLMLNGNLATAVTDAQIKCESVDIKCEPMDDPYSFVDDEPVPMATAVPALPLVFTNSTQEQSSIVPLPRKRGRKKKIKMEPGDNNMNHLMDFSQEFNPAIPGITPVPIVKERKKHDRFNGMPEEEVSKRTLPDHLTQNLDIIIIGINPGLFAAYKGHHYAGPGNHFWKCLYLSGLTPEQMSADEDYKLLQVGIGFTNMVQRATKGSADLTRKEIKEGSQILLEKLQRFKPKIAVFNGKLIYEVFSGKKDFSFGRQPDLVDGTNTYMWVMPSSSARCAQLPRAADKVPFYAALKKFRDYLNGIVSSIDDSEVVFSDARLKTCYEAEFKSEFSTDIMDISNSTVKRDENGMPCKKKRGRPKKIKIEGEEVKKPPPVRRTPNPNAQLNSDGTKKKRGRPKKIKSEEKIEPMLVSEQTNSSIREHFSSPSPVQSPVHFCHLQQMTPPGTGSNGPYNNNSTVNATPQQMYNQSPRPQSQPFTHSDLSSEISAAISSEHLGSPAPTSPSLGPPDFDPPTSMPTEDTTECCFSSPTPSTASEHQQPPSLATSAVTYPSYNTFNPDVNTHSFVPTTMQDSISRSVKSEYKTQDMASKSLSGLESLVDQIPSIADGDSMGHGVGTGQSVGLDVAEHQNQSYSAYSNSPSIVTSNPNSAPYHYSYPTNNSLSVSSLTNQSSSFSVSSFTSDYMSGSAAAGAYPNHLMSAGAHPFIEHHVPQVPAVPVPLSYHHTGISAYGQQYTGGYASQPTLHVPSPNYPYYNSGYGHAAQPGPAGPAGYLPNHHVFDRIKPDTGYGGF